MQPLGFEDVINQNDDSSSTERESRLAVDLHRCCQPLESEASRELNSGQRVNQRTCINRIDGAHAGSIEDVIV